MTEQRRSAAVITSSSSSSSSPLDEKIRQILSDATPQDEGSVFGTISTQPGDGNGGVQLWSYGNIDQKNSLRFGDVSKFFTGMLGFVYGKIDVDDAVSSRGFDSEEYPGSDDITFGQLLSMRSGIQEYIEYEKVMDTSKSPPEWKFDGNFTSKTNVDLGWKGEALQFPPGSSILSCNTNLEIIAEATKRYGGYTTNDRMKRFAQLSSLPSFGYDDGEVPDGGWPAAKGYTKLSYPYSLPGMSGSLRGTAADLLKAYLGFAASFSGVYAMMRKWQPDSTSPGIVTHTGELGSAYGYALKRYDGLEGGMAMGYDGQVTWGEPRTIILHSGKTIFMVHFSNAITDDQLMSTTNSLMKAVYDDASSTLTKGSNLASTTSSSASTSSSGVRKSLGGFFAGWR